MGKEVIISIGKIQKQDKLIQVTVTVETKKQYDELRSHYNMTGRDLLRQIIGQVYDQTFEGGK